MKRFMSGKVEGHNTSFAPSVAEFAKEARRVQSKMPVRQKAIERKRVLPEALSEEERARVRFGLKVWKAATDTKKLEGMPSSLNAHNLSKMVEFAESIGVEIPDEIRLQL